ncbi:MAG: TadE family protein [Planctomycetota bacterium]
MRQQSATTRSTRRGVAATEFAVCLPVMILLLLGMIETCSAIFLKQSLAVAAYEGAHTAVVPGATAADVRRVAEGVLADRRVQGGSVDVLPSGLDAIAPGQPIEVRVSAPSDGNTLISGRFFRGRTLTSTAVFVKEI